MGEFLPIIDFISVYTSSNGTCFRAEESANFNLLGKLSEIRYLFLQLV